MTKPESWIVEVSPAEGGGDGKVSAGPVYRFHTMKDGFHPLEQDAKTLYESFKNAVTRYSERPCLGTRQTVDGKAGDFVYITYEEAGEKATLLGNSLRAAGVEPHDCCGILSANTAKWQLTMQACNAHSVYCVPLYDTLGPDAIKFIINHAEVSIIFVQADRLFQALGQVEGSTKLKTVVSFGAVTDEAKAKATALDVVLHDWDSFCELGQDKPVKPVPPKAEDICTIMYTSGTTGEPKGVVLTHDSIIKCCSGVFKFLKDCGFQLTEEDVFLSYLPLAHIMDRAIEETFLAIGAGIAYWQGDVKLLSSDIEAARPTLFAGVPRIFDRIYSATTGKVEEGGPIVKWLYNFGFKRKLSLLDKGADPYHASPIFDTLVFNKVKKRLGGRVRLILSGGAPLARHVEDFLRVAMCAPVVQGYGLTETCAASFVAVPLAGQTGTVGPPMPSIEFRLESVPEMDYDALGTPARGEVCIGGPTVFHHYHKRDDLTKEVLVDGWFHTGDVGEILPDGTLRIFDRKKNIFKLSQGEYVAVESIENTLGQCPGVEMVWVYGNSFEASLVAVVVPSEAALADWAKGANKTDTTVDLCKDPAACKHFLALLTATAKKAQLKGFQIPKAVSLEPVPFDVERDLLTPTFKKKRPQLRKYYKVQIDAMYAELQTTDKA